MPTKPRRRRLISLRGVGELAQHQTPRHNDAICGVGLRQEERMPGFTIIRRLAIRFQGMLRRHKENKLEEWLDDAKSCGIPAVVNFARTLMIDIQAVRRIQIVAAHWSTRRWMVRWTLGVHSGFKVQPEQAGVRYRIARFRMGGVP